MTFEAQWHNLGESFQVIICLEGGQIKMIMVVCSTYVEETEKTTNCAMEVKCCVSFIEIKVQMRKLPSNKEISSKQ